MNHNRKLILPGLIACLLAGLVGCGGDGTEQYVQSADTARDALELALSTWKSGQTLQQLTLSGDTKVDVYDARWRDGQALESFTILEELPGDPHPKFKVEIKLKDALAAEENTYIVVGIGPISVFRDEDYAAATGM
jgi:hypothetical protein